MRLLSRFAQLGISLTTMGTALLFLLGLGFYDGMFSKIGVSISDIPVSFGDLLIPKQYSLILLYHIMLGWLGALDLSKPSKQLESSEKKSASYRMETRVSLGITAFSACFLIKEFFWGRRFISVSIFSGWMIGWILHLTSRWASRQLKVMLVALSLLACVMQAHYAGTIEYSTRAKAVVVRINGEDNDRILLKLYEGDRGVYFVEMVEKELRLLFLRWDRIDAIRSVIV